MPWVLLLGLGVLVAALGRKAGEATAPTARARPKPAPYPFPPGSPGPPPLTPAEAAIVASLTPDTQQFLAQVLTVAAAEGLRPRLVSGRRSCAEQAANWAKGRTAPGPIVTDAKGCRSWHVQGRAVDVAFPPSMGSAPYRHLGAIANQYGGKWGIKVQGGIDFPHIEYHPGMTIETDCPDAENCVDKHALPLPCGEPEGEQARSRARVACRHQLEARQVHAVQA